jgi:hypothetical protein
MEYIKVKLITYASLIVHSNMSNRDLYDKVKSFVIKASHIIEEDYKKQTQDRLKKTLDKPLGFLSLGNYPILTSSKLTKKISKGYNR